MLSWIVTISIRQRIVLLALCVVWSIVGLRAARRAPLDVFPEFAPPIVEVQTEAPGLSSEEVESLVTIPLENLLTGIPDVSVVRSKSVLGLSQVVLVLPQGADHLHVRQLVHERLSAAVGQLPAVAKPPMILQPLSSTSRVLKIGISSKKLTQRELTLLAYWTIRPKLMSVPGVANVAIWGQRDTQFQVIVDPDRLRANGVSLDAVLRAAGDAAAIDTGGFVDTPNQRLAVRHVSTLADAEDLAETVVAWRGNAPVRLGEVAEVVIGSPPEIGDAVINDGPGLLLIVEKQPNGNTLDVTRGVEESLEQLKPGLVDVQVDPTIFRPATFIERALHNLTTALAIGCGLVIVILLLFLFNWRSALVSVTALPLSLTTALQLIIWSGATINTMVLAGLVIALGELVDDAIIDVENIVRRAKQNRQSPNPLSTLDLVVSASLEVRSAVVHASLIVAVVFLPVFFLDGLAGAFFRPLALAYVLAILASLVVALTVTPALSSLLLMGKASDQSEPWLNRRARQAYRALLPAIIPHGTAAMFVLIVAFVLAGIAASRLGQEFLPHFRETDFLMHFVEKPGTSVEAMRRVTIAASNELRAIPGVRNFGSHIGRAEVADEVVGPNFTELWISIDDQADYEGTLHHVEEVVLSYPGLYRDVLTYLRERIKEVLTGASASIVVRLYGSDLDVLRAKAHELEHAMAEVPGVSDLKVEAQTLVPQIEVRFRPEAAERYGLTAGLVRRAATALLKGAKVGEVFRDQKKFDVVVWGSASVRADLDSIRSLPIDTPSGVQVRLGDVADVGMAPTPNEIKRENASRRLDVTCNVRGRDLASVAQEIEALVRAAKFDTGYHAEVLGEYAAHRASRQRLQLLSIAAVAGVVLLLYMDFQAWRPTLLVALTIAFALIGGVAAVWMTGGVLSLGSLVGFVTVLGIAARNGILMVSHMRHLEFEEQVPFGPGLVIQGAEERLVPILMTALATGLALVPLVIAGEQAGHEIEHPLAVVILGGLATSTILNLFLLPPLYARFGRRPHSND